MASDMIKENSTTKKECDFIVNIIIHINKI